MAAPPAPKKAKRSEVLQMPEESVVCEDDEADSPFTLYFVQLPDGEPTEQEINNLEMLFKAAKKSGIMPEWIDEEALDRLQSSDDFFVVPCFRGKLFRKIQARKLRVFGPPIVFESLEEQKQLPQWSHPIFSSVFEGAKISFTSIEPIKRRELVEKVAWMGGVVGDSLYHESTHLVAGKAEQSEKYKVAVRNSIKLMRKEWIEELWTTSTTTMGKFSAIDRDAVNSYALRTFEGLEMSLTSIDGADRTNLIQLVEEHGGRLPGNMSKIKCTHLITDSLTSQKYKKAVEWKTVKIVQTRWIRKCIDLGHLIDETKYHPKNLSLEHIRSSTPKRGANVTETGPDVSSIAGHGGRLSISSFNTSSVLTPMTNSQAPPRSRFAATASSSNVSSSTINNVTHVRNSNQTVNRRSDQFATTITRAPTVPLIRQASQLVTASVFDPIDELQKQIDGLDELFENCIFFICGVEEKRMDRWRRFLDQTGATRVAKIETATNVVVVAPNQQERLILRKFFAHDDISIVNVHWVAECVKQRKVISHEGYEWTETACQEDSMSQPTSSFRRHGSSVSAKTSLTSYSEPPPAQVKGIFATRSFFVHSSLGKPTGDEIRQKIVSNGGVMENKVEQAEFVVFPHSAPIHELIAYDGVVTDLYIDTCISNSKRLKLSDHPLFVPLPRPPIPLFNLKRFALHPTIPLIRDHVASLITSNGGTVLDSIDPKTFVVMMERGNVPAHLRPRTVDLSWIVASMSRCRLQPIEDHLYKLENEPLQSYQRDDDVWMKCTREKDATQDLEREGDEEEERNRIDREIERMEAMERENEQKAEAGGSCPLENPYFPDLRKPFKMRLNLEGISEIIENIESPSRESMDSLTTSYVGGILKKAVEITGRRREDQEPEAFMRPPSAVFAENRRTVSSTPVLQRSIDRFQPMDESIVEQNQEHVEELNRRYAMHPHFLVSTSELDPNTSARLLESIKNLGGIVDRDFNTDTYIFITVKLSRTPKNLSIIAAGRWCLTPDYVFKSAAAGHWLDERPFEWTLEKLQEGASEIERRLAVACSMWRNHVANMPITHSVCTELRHNGAFTGWRCVVHLEDKRTQPIVSILEAGGGVVFQISEYIEVSTHRPTHALATKSFDWNPQSAAMLKRDGVPLYMYDVVYEFLVDKDCPNRSKFLHPNFRKV